jgi:cardiolipin synthase
VGSIAYALLGINRIRRRAALKRTYAPVFTSGEFARTYTPVLASGEVVRTYAPALTSGEFVWPGSSGPPVELPPGAAHLETLASLVDRVAGRVLTGGNDVTPLVDGDRAYPALVSAIDAAQTSIGFATYIFDNDAAGRMVAEALARAAARGVTVRVLIDAVGSRYSRPPIIGRLTQHGVRAALFGRTLLPWRMPYMNLRNHRKILVVDGRIGFTGGMNIREDCLLAGSPSRPTRDLHFRLTGPVVAHLVQTFVEDWAFATNEVLQGPDWFPPLSHAGSVVARGITDGPDADFERALLVFLGALACAKTSVRIQTPYFVPDSGLLRALTVTALRGVRVEVIMPERNNLALVKWAATHQLWQILQRGCRVYYTSGPFDHSKMMIVDGAWVLIGSSNWDARSLRLNFEFDVECYDQPLARTLGEILDAKLATARRVTLDEVNGRPLPVKLRDGVARLAAPYL